MTEINFENTEVAFKIKTRSELRRANFLFRLISQPFLVKLGNSFIRVLSGLGISVNWMVKPTVYRHFVGGESLADCIPVVSRLAAGGVKSILDYSVEGKEEEEDIRKAHEETLRAIDFAGENENIPFAVFKPTAFINSRALEILGSPGKAYPDEIIVQGEKFRERVKQLCERAFLYKLPVLIDAEDSWYQNFIDQVVYEMQQLFNRERAIVYNTYQMYRRDRMGILMKDTERARKEGFFLGAKLVRGAYMEKERQRAVEMGYEDPIQESKEATDRDYNLALEYAIKNIDCISVFNGTHNENSSAYLVELMDRYTINPDDSRCWFSQLYGMSDHISFNLAHKQFNVAKYVPYGPVRHVLPYLTRRAEENTSVKGQTGRELALIRKELKRRKI